MRTIKAFAIVSALTALSACQLEGFDVEPCSLDGELAFKIHKIDGWLIDWQPRPNRVLVLEFYGPDSKFPGMWSAEFPRPPDYKIPKEPPPKLLIYGQHLAGWKVEQRPKPLRRTMKYTAIISDGARSGYAEFVAGGPFPICH